MKKTWIVAGVVAFVLAISVSLAFAEDVVNVSYTPQDYTVYTINGTPAITLSGYFWNTSMMTTIREIKRLFMRVYVSQSEQAPRLLVAQGEFTSLQVNLLPGQQKGWSLTFISSFDDKTKKYVPVPLIDRNKYPYFFVESKMEFQY